MKLFLALILCLNINAKTLTLMSYNVENLFDTVHDVEGKQSKNDWAYTPKGIKGKKSACRKIGYYRYRNECFNSDWTKDKLDLKLDQISRVVLSTGKLPAILALSEIENEKVIKMLAAKLGYTNFFVSHSPDHRGVDLALLYSESTALKLISKKEHVLKEKYFDKRPSRNILEGEFLVNQKYPLTIFVNHWPSLGNPTKTRIVAANLLKNRINQILDTDKSHRILAVGDFNTIDSNFPHPFKSVLLKDRKMFDLHEMFKKDRNISYEIKKSLPLGSYFYAKTMSWNLLDRIFYSQSFNYKKGLKLIRSSYRIHAPDFITKTYEYTKDHEYLKGSRVVGTPKRYDHLATKEYKAGFSDHFPLLVKLKY